MNSASEAHGHGTWGRDAFLDRIADDTATFGDLLRARRELRRLVHRDESVRGFNVSAHRVEDSIEWSVGILTARAHVYVSACGRFGGKSRRIPRSRFVYAGTVPVDDYFSAPGWENLPRFDCLPGESATTCALRRSVLVVRLPGHYTGYLSGASWLHSWRQEPTALALSGLVGYWDELSGAEWRRV